MFAGTMIPILTLRVPLGPEAFSGRIPSVDHPKLPHKRVPRAMVPEQKNMNTVDGIK